MKRSLNFFVHIELVIDTRLLHIVTMISICDDSQGASFRADTKVEPVKSYESLVFSPAKMT